MSSDTPSKLSRGEFLKLAALAPTAWLLRGWLRTLSPASLAGTQIGEQGSSQAGDTPEVVKRFDTQRPYYALTIDDGWSQTALEDSLDILDEQGLKADFFMIGAATMNAERFKPGLMKRLAEAGHGIGYHSMWHDYEQAQRATLNEWIDDYRQWLQVHQETLGQELAARSLKKYARAPGGYFTYPFLSMCQVEGLTPYGWSSDPSSFTRKVEIERGDILLLHVRYPDIEYIKNLGEYTDGDLTPTTLGCLRGEGGCPYAPYRGSWLFRSLEDLIAKLERLVMQ